MDASRRTLLDGVDPATTRRVHGGVACAVAAQLVLVAWTLLLADTIPTAFEGRSITSRLVLLTALVLVRALLRDASSRLLSTASAEVRRHHRRVIARDLIAAVGSDRPSTTGEDSTLLGSDVDALDAMLTHHRPARVTAMVVPVVVLLVAGILDPVSMAILLFTGPMLVALLALVGARTRTLTDRRLRELGWLRSFHLDMVRGIPTLRVFGRSREGAQTIGTVSDRYARSTMDVLRTAFQTSLVIEWAATAATALVAVQVGLRLTGGHIGFGAALAVLLLTPEFFAPLRSLAVEYHAGQTGDAALERLTAVERSTNPSRTIATPARTAAGAAVTSAPEIVVDDVTVTAPSSGRELLRHASFRIAAGESVALVGPSGTGKTTVARMMLALAPIDAGEIRVDGTSLDELDPDGWRRSITFVSQRPAILTGTIADNIVLSAPGSDPSAVAAAARLAGVDEFADRLPHGLDTAVGEGGLRLSGGQRQRIAIARAVLRDAPVVVLDEFTAHLDPRTEDDLVARMVAFLDGRTTLLIAHREATLRLADRVLRLDGGSIAEVDR